jgi:hypothetical protein
MPFGLFFALYDHDSLASGFVFGLVLSSVGALVALLHLAWMRAVWRGSIRGSRLGLLYVAALGALTLLVAAVTLDARMLATREIWFHIAAGGMQLALLAAMGLGSATVLLHRHDGRLTSLLRLNPSRTPRDDLRHLAGLVLPHGSGQPARTLKSVALSALAVSVEGAAFYVYLDTPSNLREAAALLPSASPRGMSHLEGHYFAIATIVCLVMPVLYVGTQVTLAGAQRLHTAARRAARRPAQAVMHDDDRPPILFLRDFRNDQVSLDRAAVPAWTRVVDPGLEQANIEDVLQSWASVGPLVAIGRPGEQEAPIGAARHYVCGEDWRDVVTSLMDRAAAVVVGVSGSAGLAWEIDRLRDRGHLDKCVLVMPPTTRGHHELAGEVVSRLVAPHAASGPLAMTVALRRAVGPGRITGLTARDSRLFQKRALAEGLPYQTLISSLLHKYAAGRLKEV